MNYKAVLFDLDGTLLDTLDDLADSMNGALADLGFPTHDRDPYRYFIGDGMRKLVERVLPEDQQEEATVLRCEELMKAKYGESWAIKTRPYDGVPELLDALAEREVPMAILSNKPDPFTKKMVTHFLGRWPFEAVLGMRPEVPKKPDPAAALEVAELLGIPAEQFLYLGDTNTDMRTAVGAGMYPVGARWGFRTADELTSNGAKVLIERPLELVPLL